MSNELRELQAKYLVGIETMSLADAERFLTLLQNDADSPFRADRIPKLKHHIAGIYRKERADADWENDWRTAAYEDRDTKERWLAAGANWSNPYDILTVWAYEGTEFYRWWGGFNRPSVTEEIVKVREADARLMALIEKGRKDE